ncbi:hypothetical protein [Pontibacter actiniarum]|uniref:Uncharacterized protein n=1 Tax=Pontibacter actiniarum TaxID=323450 RepID=A0A1X9YU40_9BACT|nr:hypothetical protein [Pontibacter actiniarum]ARS36378.1 hypothetical protein CA264_13555 [Pontibacter actiniarum]
MITHIQGPEGSSNTQIQVKDILYLKTHQLSFFDTEVFNLYVFVKKGDSEHFYLFIYKELLPMQLAFEQLTAAMETPLSGTHTIYFSPDLHLASEEV